MPSKLFHGSALAVLLCAACGGSAGDSSTPGAPSPAPGGAMTITILRQNGNQSFSPNPASAGGQMVVFRNSDTIVHRVRLNDGSVETGDIPPGATSRAVQMPSDGTNYHCPLHPDMVGGVSAASGAPPPPCIGDYCGDGDGTY